MLNYDPRKISIEVYTHLKQVKEKVTDTKLHDEQRNQAIELYTYIATWGLIRLKGEEPALVNKPQKEKIVECFFSTLGKLVYPNINPNPLIGTDGLDKLTELKASEYLGLTGVALQVAREFSFWAESLYAKSTSTK
jgi:hypothetical protein